MIAFLPYPDFFETMKCLDDKRLNSQVSEASMMLTCITSGAEKWDRHPVTRMWIGFPQALIAYFELCCEERLARGMNETILRVRNRNRFKSLIEDFDRLSQNDLSEIDMPGCIGWEPLHSSHRSQLLMKDPGYYSRYGWTEQPGTPYLWP